MFLLSLDIIVHELQLHFSNKIFIFRIKNAKMTDIPSEPNQQDVAHRLKQSSIEDDILMSKRRRLTRSSSLQKMRDLNVLICSYNFFMLPKSNTWLKSSHSAFKDMIENYIVFLKLLVASVVKQNEFSEEFQMLTIFLNKTMKEISYKIRNSNAMPTIAVLMFVVHRSIFLLINKTRKHIFKLCIYLTFMLIFLQLAVCIIIMSREYLSLGLIFLFVCIYLICHINAKMSLNYLKHNEHKTKRKIIQLNNSNVL